MPRKPGLSSVLDTLEPDTREAIEAGVIDTLVELGIVTLPKTGDQLEFDFMREGVRD